MCKSGPVWYNRYERLSLGGEFAGGRPGLPQSIPQTVFPGLWKEAQNKMLALLRAFGNWLRSLFFIEEDEYRLAKASLTVEREVSLPEEPSPDRVPLQAALPEDDQRDALVFRERVQTKLHKLAADFNAGTINRDQFRDLYAHYQGQLQGIEQVIEAAEGSDEWKGRIAEGESIMIRRQHIPRARGYAIFENDSGMPVSTLGQFQLDPALLVPMLASYRSAAKEAFGASTRSTEMEDGRWMCFVPGEYTTLLALFTAEPAGKQLKFLKQLHELFEQANHRHLAQSPVESAELIFPHEYYLGQWRR